MLRSEDGDFIRVFAGVDQSADFLGNPIVFRFRARKFVALDFRGFRLAVPFVLHGMESFVDFVVVFGETVGDLVGDVLRKLEDCADTAVVVD